VSHPPWTRARASATNQAWLNCTPQKGFDTGAQEAIYFVTRRLAQAQPELNPSERELVASALEHFEGKCYLTAFMVMNDHVHELLSTMEPTC
jgi:hypothetical protein